MEEGTIAFIVIVITIFGILQIMLSFKLWGMTDDVKKIKKSFTSGEGPLMEAQIYYMKGDMVKCKDILDEALFREILTYCNKAHYSTFYYDWSNYKIDLKKTSEKYKNIYVKMGIDMPDIEKYKDYMNLPIDTGDFTTSVSDPGKVAASSTPSVNPSAKTGKELENPNAKWLKNNRPDLFNSLLKESFLYHSDEKSAMNEVNRHCECYEKIPNVIENEFTPLHTNENGVIHFYNLYITHYNQDCTFDEFISMNKGRYTELKDNRIKVNRFIYDFDKNLKLRGVYK
jgi:hypothetical protein